MQHIRIALALHGDYHFLPASSLAPHHNILALAQVILPGVDCDPEIEHIGLVKKLLADIQVKYLVMVLGFYICTVDAILAEGQLRSHYNTRRHWSEQQSVRNNMRSVFNE